MLETTFRVLDFRDWFGVSTPVTKPISEPAQTKEPGRNFTRLFKRAIGISY